MVEVYEGAPFQEAIPTGRWRISKKLDSNWPVSLQLEFRVPNLKHAIWRKEESINIYELTTNES
jgi:hypothetical protein